MFFMKIYFCLKMCLEQYLYRMFRWQVLYQDLSRHSDCRARNNLIITIYEFRIVKERKLCFDYDICITYYYQEQKTPIITTKSKNLYSYIKNWKRTTKPFNKWAQMSPDGATENKINCIMSTRSQIFNYISVINSLRAVYDIKW